MKGIYDIRNIFTMNKQLSVEITRNLKQLWRGTAF
jgi:hypothetical protein